MNGQERNHQPMSDINLLTSLIVKQQEINQETAAALGKMSGQLDDMSQFIKNVYAGYKSGDETLMTKLVTVEAKADVVAQKHRDAKKWLTGAVAVISFEGMILGYYCTHIATKVATIVDTIKGTHTP